MRTTRAGTDDQPRFGAYFNAGTILLSEASCYIEAGRPAWLAEQQPSSYRVRRPAA